MVRGPATHATVAPTATPAPLRAPDAAPAASRSGATADERPSPQLLEALLESSADAFYLVDPAGRVQFANGAAIELLGYDDEAELLGAPSHETIHHTRPDGTPYPAGECPLLRPRTTGEVVRVELDWFVRRDGRMVPVGYSSSPVQTDAGRGAVVVFRRVDPAAAEARESDAAEVHAASARLVAAADAARRRISRDLHDGAQQRLVGVLVTLRAAVRELDADGRPGPNGARTLVDRACDEVQAAIGDLRDLASGVHPAVLTDHGLPAAVRSLAQRCPVPVRADVPARRWATSVEATAYFVVAEALTNVAKHAAAAGEVRVDVRERAGHLRVRVADDGPGGAAESGGGLTGLADRVALEGGRLEVSSREGAGTTILAVVPVHRPGGPPA